MEKWEKIGPEVVMAGKYGKKLITQLFRNPKTGKDEDYVLFAQKEWSVVLPVTADWQVIRVKEYKQGRDSVDIELPAGTANFEGEDPLEVITRELLEETGYKAGKMIYLGIGWMATRNSPTRYHVFLALNCYKAGEPRLDDNEIIEFSLVPLQEWIDAVVGGAITEHSAVMATTRALPFLGLKIVPV